MESIYFTVDGWQWDELYENTEDRTSPHPIHEGTNIKVQLQIWPRITLSLWTDRNLDELQELDRLGLTTTPPQHSVSSLRRDSSLCLLSGVVRETRKFSWSNDPNKQTIDTLLDCGIPVVLSEETKKGETGSYPNQTGDFIAAICFLYGALTHSPSLFESPIICKVQTIKELPNVTADRILLGAEPQTLNTKSEIEHELYYDRIDAPRRGFNKK
ncbi:hypothetical protein AUI06_08225 [archaeon 13_2_20CM_2_52_21]|nr:MAG: hypothetical protein AUI06_08225 [archaeon 13_2_20CM_2_52_21]